MGSGGKGVGNDQKLPQEFSVRPKRPYFCSPLHTNRKNEFFISGGRFCDTEGPDIHEDS